MLHGKMLLQHVAIERKLPHDAAANVSAAKLAAAKCICAVSERLSNSRAVHANEQHFRIETVPVASSSKPPTNKKRAQCLDITEFFPKDL